MSQLRYLRGYSMNLTNTYHYKKGLNGKEWQELFDKIRMVCNVRDIRKIKIDIEYRSK